MDKRFKLKQRFTYQDLANFEIETAREAMAYAKALADIEGTIKAEIHSTCMNYIDRANIMGEDDE